MCFTQRPIIMTLLYRLNIETILIAKRSISFIFTLVIRQQVSIDFIPINKKPDCIQSGFFMPINSCCTIDKNYLHLLICLYPSIVVLVFNAISCYVTDLSKSCTKNTRLRIFPQQLYGANTFAQFTPFQEQHFTKCFVHQLLLNLKRSRI